jgi:hypothetical protein
MDGTAKACTLLIHIRVGVGCEMPLLITKVKRKEWYLVSINNWSSRNE